MKEFKVQVPVEVLATVEEVLLFTKEYQTD